MDTGTKNARRRRGPGFVTPNACTECRLKRTKCDGQAPCSRCVSQNVPNCVYEAPSRQSKEEMRSEINKLRTNQQQTERILHALASNDHYIDILEQLRNGEELEAISRRLQGPTLTSTSYKSPYDWHNTMGSIPSLSNGSGTYHSPLVQEDWHEQPAEKDRMEFARDLGQQVLLGDEFDSQDALSHHGLKYSNESWTTVTSDTSLVEHLLALYFCWEYPIFATVSKEHFIEDFRKGNPRYCSSLLVNALLALACRFSDRPSTRRKVDDGTTAGDDFFAEALNLFNDEDDRHILTTVQALGVMSIREASCGRINESYFLSSQSISLATEMGLHTGDFDEEDDDDEDNAEKAVREATFWGALSLDEMLSLCTGTLPHMSRRINFPRKPAIIQDVEQAFWIPYTDDGMPLDQHFDQPSNLRSVYKTFCELSESVHKALYSLYSPGSEVDGGTLITAYNRYIHWYDTMPESLRLGHNFTPSVLFAHMFYHSATLLLFQPFIHLKLNKSAVIPREVCYQAANAITGIVKSYASLYTLRRTPSFVPYFVLISSIIHMIAVKSDPLKEDMRQNVSQGFSDLEDMAKCHGFAIRAIEALRDLALRWGINISSEENTTIRDTTDKSRRPSSAVLDQFSPDVSVLAMLQSIQPVLSSNDPPLFSPFPMQGVPQVAHGSQPEKGGFKIAPQK